MSSDDVHSLVEFLKDVKPEVRLVAASHLLTVCSTPEGAALLSSDDVKSATESFSRMLASNEEMQKIALSFLINVSDMSIVQDTLLNKKSISSIFEIVNDKNTKDDLMELGSMLLMNLTRNSSFAMQLIDPESEFAGRKFLALCGKFLASKEKDEKRDALGWLASVLQNCSQLEESRKFLLDPKRSIMSHLSEALVSCKTVRRRRGIAATIRNCLFETSQHGWLVEPPVNLLRNVLTVLVDGRGNLDGDEKRALPVEVREAAFDVEHYERDAETRRLLLESIVLLCTQPLIAEKIKQWSGYPIMRELERFEKDDAAMEQIHTAVDLLVREHEGLKKAEKQEGTKKSVVDKEKEIEELQREILRMNEEDKALSVCNNCGKSAPEVKLSRCTGCFNVSFCSRKCQVAKWKEHKPVCKKKEEDDDEK